MQYDSFHDAFIRTLDLVYLQPEFVNAPRGFHSRERLNSHFTLTNPRERVCYLPSRKTNIVFNFAEVLWYLSGDNTLDYIAYYAKHMPRYSMDDRTLTGTAYGPKIFRFGDRQINQWAQVVDLLRDRDPDSKRAFIQIFSAEEWLVKDNIDVSCTLGLQFLVREQKLYLASFMRANDAFRGIVSDVFSFTFMQELMACELSLELGSYYHNVGSIHTYDSDEAWIKQVLAEAHSHSGTLALPFEFPAMPPGNHWESIHIVLDFERRLRTGKLRLNVKQVEAAGLPTYWQQVVLLFGLYRRVVDDGTIDGSLYEQLWPVYQQLVANKWKAR